MTTEPGAARHAMGPTESHELATDEPALDSAARRRNEPTVPGPAAERRQRLQAVAIVAIAALTLVYLLLARFGLGAFPASGDEHSYLLQGQIFAEGHLSVPAPPHAELFQVDHVILDDVVRSKYPPGWPALLAVGWLVGAPWIVNPLLGGLILALVHATARRLHGAEAALVATLMLGCSPFFALNCASYHSHASALFAEVLYACALVRASMQDSGRAARFGLSALAGIALGFLFLTRPFEAAFAAVGALAFFRRPRLLLVCGAAAAVVAALFFVYDAAQFGSPWKTGYGAFAPIATELWGPKVGVELTPRYLVDPETQWHHLGWFVDLAPWLVPGFLLFAVAGLVRPEERRPADRFFLVLAVAHTASVLPMADNIDDAYGPRYLLPLLLPMAIAAGAAWVRIRHFVAAHPRLEAILPARRSRLAWLALAACLAAGGARTGVFTEQHHEDNVHRGALYRRVAELGLAHAVILVKTGSRTLLARNLSVFDGPVLYVSTARASARGMTDEDVARLFPDRVTYAASQSAADSIDWTITRVR